MLDENDRLVAFTEKPCQRVNSFDNLIGIITLLLPTNIGVEVK
jgi:hypothetical protein